MTLSELLEALNTILPHKLIEDTPQRRQYGIAYKDMLIMLVFDVFAEGSAVVSFYEHTEQNTPSYKQSNKLTYSGPLFATVIGIIKEEFRDLDIIAYTASGKSRASLYGTLAKKYSSGKQVYILPTSTVEITVVSKLPLDSDTLNQITQIAQHAIDSK